MFLTKRSITLFVVALVVGALGVVQAQTNLISNGSFETPSVPVPPGFAVYSGGSSFGGWTALSPGPAPGGAGYAAGTGVTLVYAPGVAADGNQFLNLHAVSAGGVRTANFINLEKDVPYRLTFAMSALSFADDLGTSNVKRVVNVRVQRGGLRVVDEEFIFDPTLYPSHSATSPVWLYCTVDFTVPITQGYNILFRSNNVGGLSGITLGQFSDTIEPFTGPYGPIIDAVSLTVIPEPGTMALFGAGLLGVLGVLRRRA